MMISSFSFTLILLTTFQISVESHGYIKSPRSRSYIAWEEGVWSGGGSKTYPKEDCPQCANIGGTAGQCGVIGGRNYDKNLNVLGKSMPPNPQSRYRRGQVIEIDVVLTAHHMGHFEFSACPIQAGGVAKGSCFDKYRLKFVKDPLYGATKDPDYPYRAYLSPASYAKRDSDDRGLLYRFQMKLPDNLTGDLVLLQWHYYTSNSCTYPGYSKYSFPSKWGKVNTGQGICKNIPSDGRGLPEQFWGCSEISISGSGSGSSGSSGSNPSPNRGRSTSNPKPAPSTASCGNGQPGNGKCADSSLCCSKWGYCGTGSAYCSNDNKRRVLRNSSNNTLSLHRKTSSRSAACGDGSIGNGRCADSSLCCSQWGYCGTGVDYCAKNPTKSPVPVTDQTGNSRGTCGGGKKGNGRCANSSLCCSKWGYCGTGSAFCKKTKSPKPMQTKSPVTVTEQTGNSRGTCGGGNIGNSRCADSSLCCSKWGYCGSGSEYCNGEPKPAPSPSGGGGGGGGVPAVTPISLPNYADGDCSGISNVMKVNVGYYQSWAIYRSNGCNPVTPQDININGNGYTHLIYTFASINSNSELEPWAGNYDSEVPQYRKFNSLKQSNSNLKTLIAVGGWTFNDPGPTLTRFSDTASTAARRQKFAKSCVQFCNTYDFDGVDLDWEYPGDPERGGDAANDKKNFVLLIEAIRSAFDDASRDLQLTMAIPVAKFRLEAGYDLAALSKGISFFNLMTYDIYGAWDVPKSVGANADMPFIFESVKYIRNEGVPSNKMVLGLAAYGRSYIMADGNCRTAGCTFVSGGPGGCAGETGFMPYFTIQEYVDRNNYDSLKFNKDTGTMELAINGNVFITYDTPASFKLKYNFASKSCFRGIMWWAVDMKKDAISLN